MKVHKKLSDLLFRYLLFLFTIVTVIAVIMIGVYMFQSGGPSIAKVGIKNFLFGKTWDTSVEPAKYGILPFLLSSVFSMIGTVVITVPVSILVAVGMSHFIPRPVASVLRTVISMLAGIPSVIYGFFGNDSFSSFCTEYVLTSCRINTSFSDCCIDCNDIANHYFGQ